MPGKPRKPCAKPGCNKLTRERYCPKHQNYSRKLWDKTRGTSKERGYDSQWRKTRKVYLAVHPICECGCGRLADTVHHIISVEEKPKLRLVWANLKAMKRECHEKEHGRLKGE